MIPVFVLARAWPVDEEGINTSTSIYITEVSARERFCKDLRGQTLGREDVTHFLTDPLPLCWQSHGSMADDAYTIMLTRETISI